MANNLDIIDRLYRPASTYKAMQQAINSGLRVALPCKIMSFDSTAITVVARPLITENVNILDPTTMATSVVQKQIPDLLDVPLLIYSDESFAITMPNIVGAECLVIFADMCFNAWWANGSTTDSNGQVAGQNQERIRRHSLSDGFAILSPKSQPSAKNLTNYSTTALEIRSLDGNAVISIDEDDNIEFKTTDGDIKISGPTVEAATYTNITNSLPITINGVQYYIKLSTAP